MRFVAGFLAGAAAMVALVSAAVWRALADRDPYR